MLHESLLMQNYYEWKINNDWPNLKQVENKFSI